MSRENVELVVKLLPVPGQNLVPLFRDDDVWAAFAEAVAPFFHPDFETVIGGVPEGARTAVGLEGFRVMWRDWTAPWATYRTEIDETVDLGDRVFVLFHDFACMQGTSEALKQTPANIWTVLDGKIARAEFYTDWSDALKVLGLEE
jgi:ketosteroid isomerase-like protein